MPSPPARSAPSTDWEGLLDLAASQAGLFTTSQAHTKGFGPELLIHHVQRGRLVRVRRGIYRVRHLPPSEDEQLVETWLWSGMTGVFSHRTALGLFDLSDVLPSRIDLTVPASWVRRRVRAPAGVDLHPSDVPEADRTWVGHVPVTKPARTVVDCAHLHIAPDLVGQAIEEGTRRGMFTRDDVAEAIEWVERFQAET